MHRIQSFYNIEKWYGTLNVKCSNVNWNQIDYNLTMFITKYISVLVMLDNNDVT